MKNEFNDQPCEWLPKIEHVTQRVDLYILIQFRRFIGFIVILYFHIY